MGAGRFRPRGNIDCAIFPRRLVKKSISSIQFQIDLLAEWDSLSADEKKLFIRQVDVFAAYEAYNDHEIGRVFQAVDDMGKLDNTLIIYINGDNGNSAEGTLIGTPNEIAMFNGANPPVEAQLKYFYDSLGHRQDLQPHGRALVLGI